MADRPAHAASVRAALLEAPLWLVWRLAHGLELGWRALTGIPSAGRRARHREPGADGHTEDSGDPQVSGPDSDAPAA